MLSAQRSGESCGAVVAQRVGGGRDDSHRTTTAANNTYIKKKKKSNTSICKVCAMVVPILQMRKSLHEAPKLRPRGARIEIHTVWLQGSSLPCTVSPIPTTAQEMAVNRESMHSLHSLSVPNDPVSPTWRLLEAPDPRRALSLEPNPPWDGLAPFL